MKKILISVAVLLAVVIAGALVAPSLIDWNDYKAVIAGKVGEATGRKLTIDGGINVAVLPSPKLSVTKVRLANLDGAKAPDMARLDALDVQVAFWPLLSGKVVVRSIVLRGADIELEHLADGRVNWDFGGGAARGPSAPAGSTGGGGGEAVSLEQVTIAGGRVTYRDSRGRGAPLRIDDIDARIAAATLSGPVAVSAKARMGGVPFALEGRAGKLIAGRPTAVSADLSLPDAKAKAKVSGTVITGGKPRIQARVELAGDDLGALVAEAGKAAGGGAGEAPAMLRRKFSATAGIDGDDRTLAVNDLSVQINGTRLVGGVNVTLGTVPTVDVTMAVRHLDLNAWLKDAAAKGTPAPSKSAAGAGKPPPFALPDGIRVSFDGRIDGITYRKGAVRNVVIRGALDRGVLNLSRLGGDLPGGAEARIAGRLRAEDGAPRFDGTARIAADDIRAVFDWLDIDDSAIAPDRLHKASFSAALSATGGRVEVRDIDLRFDSTRLRGGVVVALRDRPGIGANLMIDGLNLDAYMAKAKPGAKAAPTAAAGSAAGGGSALGAFDANLRVQLGSLIVKGMTLNKVSVDSTLLKGDATLRRLVVGDVGGGGRLEVSGKIAALDRAPLPDLTFKLTSAHPERLFALGGVELPVAAKKLTPFAAQGSYQAKATTGRVKAELAAGALKVSLDGGLAGLDGAPRGDVALKIAHPSFIEFVRLFDPGFTPTKPAKGPFSLSAKAALAGLDLRLERVEARFGEARVAGTATVALAAQRPKITADFTGGEIVADHFVPKSIGQPGAGPAPAGAAAPSGPPWTDTPFELDGMRAVDADITITAKTLLWRSWRVSDPRIDMTLADGRFDLRRVSGRTVGGTFQVTGSLAAPAKRGGAAEFRSDVDITRADLRQAMFNAADLDLADGTVTYRMNVAGRGATSRALVSSLKGSGVLEAVNGQVRGFDLGRVNEQLKNLNEPISFLTLLQTAMSGGTTRFSSLKGTFRIDKGVVRSDDIALIAEGGTGQGTLVADLPRWLIDAKADFRLSGHRDAPPFGMELKGPLDKPRRVFKLNELQAWLVSRGVGSLIERFAKPKTSPQGTAPSQPAQPSPQQNPDEFIRGIFDLLQKKK